MQGTVLESYSVPHMKKYLLEHFGDKIIAEIMVEILSLLKTLLRPFLLTYRKPKLMDTSKQNEVYSRCSQSH